MHTIGEALALENIWRHVAWRARFVNAYLALGNRLPRDVILLVIAPYAPIT